MKIALINDSETETEIIISILKQRKDYDIVWKTVNLSDSVANYKRLKPDIILVKLNIADSVGSLIIKTLMEIDPVAILILSDPKSNNQTKIFEAMGFGALDVVNIPFFEGINLIGSDDLIKKIDLFSKLINYHKETKNSSPLLKTTSENRTRIVAIGSSTGGPKALSSVFRDIPINVDAAFVIIQHVDAQFATGLADWLKNYSKLPIFLAEHGQKPLNGNIYIAHTNDHLYLNSIGKFEYTPKPVDLHFRPSVDVFFKSLKSNWHYNDIAVLLTGMGNDGAAGLLELKQKGWFTIAQDELTSVVYGMPRAAKEINAAIEILPINKIAQRIIEKLNF